MALLASHLHGIWQIMYTGIQVICINAYETLATLADFRLRRLDEKLT